jgi:lycopene beta-cyclase
MQANKYDYIFLGAGCATLSIVMRMISSNKFGDKKILIIDKEPKNKNDRTWCFWEKEPGFFNDIVYHKWNELLFETGKETLNLDMENYEYKMIRGIDFYKKCFSIINLQENIDITYGEISFTEKSTASAGISVGDDALLCKEDAVIFNSIYNPAIKQKKKFYLLQHFKGWVIETGNGMFNPAKATLMDFSVPQADGTSFVYVLPLADNKALVEYTVFSESLLDRIEYDKRLKMYLADFAGVNNYVVTSEEFGVIPMTNEKFPAYKNGMYFIGTAGGQTKATTGYTFRFIQKQADKIVAGLIAEGKPLMNEKIKKRFLFYDSTLLHILSKKLLDGKSIFSTLFKKNSAAIIFKFLDNESSVKEETRLLNSLPKRIFIKAGASELIKMIFGKRRTIY